MDSITLGFAWYERGKYFNHLDSPGRWGITRKDCPEGEELVLFLLIDLEFRLELVIDYIDITEGCMAGRYDPGYMGGGNDGFAMYGGGNVLVASHYAETDQVLLSADDFLKVLRRSQSAMEHPDYRDPNADTADEAFQSFTVELLSIGAGASQEFVERGGPPPT